jgi:hypothetical protein
MNMETSKIFISYTVRDGKIDKAFLLDLEKAIVKTTPVYIDMLHNDSLDKQNRVINELKKSDLLFLIKTDEINNSEWVKKEIHLAESLNIPIFEFDYEELIKEKFLPITMCIVHSYPAG